MQSTCPIHVSHFAESYELQHPMVGDCTCHAKKLMGPMEKLEANRKNQVKLQKAARRQAKLSRELNASTETVENLSKDILSSEEVAEIKARALNEAAVKAAAEAAAVKAAHKVKEAKVKVKAAKKKAKLAKKLASLS